jgi:cytochrome P450 family 138
MTAAAPAIDGLPPGPRAPVPVQTLAMITRQRPWLVRQRARYGPMFSVRVTDLPRFVIVGEAELLRTAFTAPADVLHAGTASPLRAVLGDHSLLGIDEDEHLEQRRLLLPPFHGRRMQAYAPLIEEIARAEVERFPEGVPFPVAPAMQRITLRSVLRAVFGAEGAALARLEALMPPWTSLAQRLSRWPQLHRDLGPLSPWGRFVRLRARVDAALDGLIAAARRDPRLEERADVLALLVQARHAGGAPMADAEIRDELVTLLAAGHETTAHTLSWAVERLRRHPAALERLSGEVAGGGRAWREAVIHEVQRVRPVIAFAGRFTRKPFELGGHRIPPGVMLGLSAALAHTDPDRYPEPGAFRPERFLGRRPDTYGWVPFGGGVRRCIGAAFAHMELDVVLRVLLERVELLPTGEPAEGWRFRGVAWSPAAGGVAVVRHRERRAARAHRAAAA